METPVYSYGSSTNTESLSTSHKSDAFPLGNIMNLQPKYCTLVIFGFWMLRKKRKAQLQFFWWCENIKWQPDTSNLLMRSISSPFNSATFDCKLYAPLAEPLLLFSKQIPSYMSNGTGNNPSKDYKDSQKQTTIYKQKGVLLVSY